MPLYKSSPPFKDGVLTFPAPAWGFISSFISCSNNSSRSPGRAAGLRFQLCRVPGSGPSLLTGCTLLWGGVRVPGRAPDPSSSPCRGSPAPGPHPAVLLALWSDADEHPVPRLPSAGAAALVGWRWGWGRGWGRVWGQWQHCRGCPCWLRAPCPRGPWLCLLAFPRKPDSRGIFVPQRIFLIRSLHKSASHAHALISSSSKALPTHPAGAPGVDGWSSVGAPRGAGHRPCPQPGAGVPSPPWC